MAAIAGEFFASSCSREKSLKRVRLVVQETPGVAPEIVRDRDLLRGQELLRLCPEVRDTLREKDGWVLGEARFAGAQHGGAHEGCLQPDGRVVDHHELGTLDQLVGAEILLRGDKQDVGQGGRAVRGDPCLDRLPAFLAGADLVGVGADDEQGFGVPARQLDDQLQPGEHVREDGVGMRLAGVEDDVGKDRHDLLEAGRFAQEGLV